MTFDERSDVQRLGDILAFAEPVIEREGTWQKHQQPVSMF
ncbi:hypothetical protein BH11MYX2_BH11MYX2_12090 [soil metagenome]